MLGRPIATALLLVVATWGCGTGDAAPSSPGPVLSGLPDAEVERRPVRILSPFTEGDGMTIEVGVDSSGGDPTASLEETSETVTVGVTSAVVVEGDRFECQDIVPVTVDEPLGDRRLVDGGSGAEVPVEGR